MKLIWFVWLINLFAIRGPAKAKYPNSITGTCLDSTYTLHIRWVNMMQTHINWSLFMHVKYCYVFYTKERSVSSRVLIKSIQICNYKIVNFTLSTVWPEKNAANFQMKIFEFFFRSIFLKLYMQVAMISSIIYIRIWSKKNRRGWQPWLLGILATLVVATPERAIL